MVLQDVDMVRIMGDNNSVFKSWVVYKKPDDYPFKYVVREFHSCSDGRVIAAEKPLTIADNYDDVIVDIPTSATKISRSDDDDPNILEVWV